MTTNYVFLGSGTTDSNGVAKLDHDANGDPISHSYTGSGVGEVDIVASLDDPNSISDSSLQSETYDVIDGTFLDRAVDGQKNTNWSNALGTGSVLTETDGTTLTNSNTSTLHYWANNYVAFNIGTFAIEFDLIEYTDSSAPAFRLLGTNSHQLSFKNIGCLQNSHLKIIVDGTGIKYQIDNGNIVDFVTTTDTSFQVGFRFVGACSVKYKNFVVYPI